MNPSAGLLRKLFLVVGMLCSVVGCGGGGEQPSGKVVEVKCSGQPLAGVHVVLHRGAQGKWLAILEGVTDSAGKATMNKIPLADDLPAGEAVDLRATVESTGVGDWALKSKLGVADTSKLDLKCPAGDGVMVLEIPKDSVVPL